MDVINDAIFSNNAGILVFNFNDEEKSKKLKKM
jgi:hypothetical protein